MSHRLQRASRAPPSRDASPAPAMPLGGRTRRQQQMEGAAVGRRPRCTPSSGNASVKMIKAEEPVKIRTPGGCFHAERLAWGAARGGDECGTKEAAGHGQSHVYWSWALHRPRPSRATSVCARVQMPGSHTTAPRACRARSRDAQDIPRAHNAGLVMIIIVNVLFGIGYTFAHRNDSAKAARRLEMSKRHREVSCGSTRKARAHARAPAPPHTCGCAMHRAPPSSPPSCRAMRRIPSAFSAPEALAPSSCSRAASCRACATTRRSAAR